MVWIYDDNHCIFSNDMKYTGEPGHFFYPLLWLMILKVENASENIGEFNSQLKGNYSLK